MMQSLSEPKWLRPPLLLRRRPTAAFTRTKPTVPDFTAALQAVAVAAAAAAALWWVLEKSWVCHVRPKIIIILLLLLLLPVPVLPVPVVQVISTRSLSWSHRKRMMMMMRL